MARQRNHYSADFKGKAALAAMKGQQTVNEIASTYSVHPNQVSQWKKQALEALPEVFSARRTQVAANDEQLKACLYEHIGQLQVELDWLKKSAFSLEFKRQLVEPDHPQISIRRQCQLLGLNRCGLYYPHRSSL
jgi:putative transposase